VRPAPPKGGGLPALLEQLRAELARAKTREVPGTLLPGFIRDLGLEPDEVGPRWRPRAAPPPRDSAWRRARRIHPRWPPPTPVSPLSPPPRLARRLN
jgi:hypothetical protein